MIVAGFVVIVVLSTLLNGWALSVIWNWFMPVIFHLPALRLVEAMGIALTVAYLTHQYSDAQSKHDGWEAVGHAVVHTVVKPLLAVGIAWCIKSFL